MPIKPEDRKHYGHHWRTIDRPGALQRAAYECQRCAIPDRPTGLHSALEVAHLDGNPANRSEENLAALCHSCHRRVDYKAWSAQFRAWLAAQREDRIARKDAERPIFKLLEETANG